MSATSQKGPLDEAPAPTTPDMAQAPAASPEPPPAALVEFMLTRWAAPPVSTVVPVAHYAAYAARRRRVSEAFLGDTLIVPAGELRVRTNDVHFPFRPGSDFFYLTGCREPGAALVLTPTSGGHHAILFVEPDSGRTDASFFTDRTRGAFWVGPRRTLEESRAHFGVDDCRPAVELIAFLESLRADTRRMRTVGGVSSIIDAIVPKHEQDGSLASRIGELRLVKDAGELRDICAAIETTRRGFEDVIRRLPKLENEFDVEAVFCRRARAKGNGPGYPVIAAAGSRGCILHYSANDGPIAATDLLVLDAGVEGRTLYTADITRTIPVAGRFTAAQRAVYELVFAAKEAAIECVAPGRRFVDPTRAAMAVLTEGLVRLGVLTVTAEEALREDRQFYKRYTLHGVSHMLGLDVHDCACAPSALYQHGELRGGMVLTIEPGLYFQPDDLTVPPELRGIAVRIEDDVLVTKDGHKNLSAHIPSQVDAVEDWIRRVSPMAPAGRHPGEKAFSP